MTDHNTAFAALSYYDEDDVYPVSRITAAPVGDPRQRYFILQAHIGDEPVSWVIERDQARALSRQIPLLLTDIRSEFPELADPLVAAEPNLTLTEPWQPLFRVGSLGIGYDRLHDLVVFTLVDADTLEAMEDPQTEETDDPEQLVYTTRARRCSSPSRPSGWLQRAVRIVRTATSRSSILATSAHRRTRARGATTSTFTDQAC